MTRSIAPVDRPVERRAAESPSADMEEKVHKLLGAMSLEEKISQMTGDASLWETIGAMRDYNAEPIPAGENRRLGIAPLQFTDGPRGVVLRGATCFPVAM